MQAVTFAIVYGDSVAENLGASIRASRMKRRGLALRRGRAAEHLAGRRLIEPALETRQTNGLEQAQRAGGNDIGGILGDLETDFDVALSGEIINFLGADVVEQLHQRTAVRQVSVVEKKTCVAIVEIFIEMIQAIRVEAGGASF